MTDTSLAVVLPDDPSALDRVPDPAAAMVALVDQARLMLAQATGMEGLADVIEWKSRAEAIRVYTQQKDMGREAELSAAEIVRRAERRIGQLIREGQDSGEIAKSKWDRSPDGKSRLPSTADFLPPGARTQTEIRALTDGVSDEQFDEAIAEAKGEGNLSRANTLRKVKGEPPKPSRENELLHYRRRVDPNRVVEGVVSACVIPTSTFDLLDGHWSELDREQLPNWIGSLVVERTRLSRLINCLREEQERG